MSRLKLFVPAEPDLRDDAESDAPSPAILPFASRAPRWGGYGIPDVGARAALIFRNQRCRDCRRPAVEPIELNDALRNGNGAPIPGTATLVGFRCVACECEWPI